jgi:hypothetical protein
MVISFLHQMIFQLYTPDSLEGKDIGLPMTTEARHFPGP